MYTLTNAFPTINCSSYVNNFFSSTARMLTTLSSSSGRKQAPEVTREGAGDIEGVTLIPSTLSREALVLKPAAKEAPTTQAAINIAIINTEQRFPPNLLDPTRFESPNKSEVCAIDLDACMDEARAIWFRTVFDLQGNCKPLGAACKHREWCRLLTTWPWSVSFYSPTSLSPSSNHSEQCPSDMNWNPILHRDSFLTEPE